MEQDHVAWCKNLWNMLNEGGTWTIPRSGLIFMKHDGALHMIGAIEPGVDALADFEATKEHFEAAGIEVVMGI